MFKTIKFFLFVWIAALSLLGCQSVTPQPSAPIIQTVTFSNTATLLPSPSLTASTTPFPTSTLTLTPPPVPSPSFPGLLAFLGTDEYAPGLTPSRLDLFLVDENGQLTRLTEGAAVIDFAWSPDGRKLLFSAALQDINNILNYDLYLIEIDRSQLTPIQIGLDTDSVEGEAAWAPDGSKIAFTQFLGGEHRIYVMNPDGSEIHFLVEGGAPSWSSDGQNLVFVKRLLGEAVGDLYMIGADGSELRQITDNMFVNRPVFSPDGERIAFLGYDMNGQNPGIYIVQADGTGVTQLTNGLNWPSWFSTTQVLFAAKNSIFTLGIGGGPRETLIRLPTNFYLEFAAKQPEVP